MSILKKIKRSVLYKLHHFTSKFVQKDLEKKVIKEELEWKQKFVNGYFIYEFTKGVKIKLFEDSQLSRMIYNKFEIEEIGFTEKYLKTGDIFIDIGSNIGLFTLAASHVVGNTGKVISFEPFLPTFTRLIDNITMNELENIDARNLALSEKAGVGILNYSETGFDAWNTLSSTKDEKLHNKIEVQISTLDIELINIEKSKVSLIKIDVEGWEKFVLMGARELLTEYSPVILVEFTESNTFAAGYPIYELYNYFYENGYKLYKYDEGKFCEQRMKLHYPYENLIATKDINQVISRISGT